MLIKTLLCFDWHIGYSNYLNVNNFFFVSNSEGVCFLPYSAWPCEKKVFRIEILLFPLLFYTSSKYQKVLLVTSFSLLRFSESQFTFTVPDEMVYAVKKYFTMPLKYHAFWITLSWGREVMKLFVSTVTRR